MTYKSAPFKIVERGFERNMLLIPGWATDPGIFEKLDIPFNYILPENVLPDDFAGAFRLLPEGIRSSRPGLLGWSMGGFIAATLAAAHPGIFGKTILVSMRRRYGESDIEHTRDCIRRNAGAYLRKFYGLFFSGDEEGHKRWFQGGPLKKYTEDPGALHLSEGLDYLRTAELKPELLNDPDVLFVHGEDDTIAPREEAGSIKAGAPLAKFLSLEGARHFPLLKKEFSDIFEADAYVR